VSVIPLDFKAKSSGDGYQYTVYLDESALMAFGCVHGRYIAKLADWTEFQIECRQCWTRTMCAPSHDRSYAFQGEYKKKADGC